MRYFVMIGLAIIAIVLLQTGPETADTAPAAGLSRPAPEFPSAAQRDWFNSAPIRMASLRGEVVLLEIWTFG